VRVFDGNWRDVADLSQFGVRPRAGPGYAAPSNAAVMRRFSVWGPVALSLCVIACDGDEATGPDAVVAMSITPASLTLRAGETHTVSVAVMNAKGTALPGRPVTWSVANAAVAQVSTSGEVAAIAPGQTTIVASAEGRSATMPLTVQQAAVSTIALAPAAARLHATQTVTLTATVKDGRGNVLSDRPITWTSANPTVATVGDRGLVTAVAVGSTTITATSEGMTAIATVAVEPVPVHSVVIQPFGEGLSVGEALQLYAVPLDSTGRALSGRVITWASDVPTVARISTTGAVIAVTQGRTTVTACAEPACTSVPVTVVPDRLTAADSLAQTRHLERLSVPWHSTRDANDIFLKSQYSTKAWAAFFRSYFATHEFTDDLRGYFVCLMILWFDDAFHQKIRPAFATMAPSMVHAIFSRNPNLEHTLTADAGARATLNNTFGFLAELAGRDDAVGAALFSHYEQLILQYPEIFTRPTNRLTQPYTGALKRDVTTNYAIVRPLTPALTARIATTLQLATTRLDIWNRHGVLVSDNEGLDAEQLAIIDRFLTLIPKEWRPLQAITVNDFFTRSTQWRGAVSYIADRAAVNIFGTKPGVWGENQFPTDIAPRVVPGFASTVAHEINHIVDNPGILHDPYFGPRRQALLRAAGTAPLHYLRSSPDAGVFFTNAPQEFFASIANQWFADSEHTIRLGRQRFDAGMPHPLNQALFFAEAYARGRSTTLLYALTAQGHLSVYAAPVERDGSGRVTAIATADSLFRFSRNADGDVVSHSAVKR
jgi:uncharacterized protein YjdB